MAEHTTMSLVWVRGSSNRISSSNSEPKVTGAAQCGAER